MSNQSEFDLSSAVAMLVIIAAAVPVFLPGPDYALLVIIAAVWFGADRINAGQMQVGSLVAFLSYLIQILMAVMMAGFAVAIVVTRHRRDVSMLPATCLAQLLLVLTVFLALPWLGYEYVRALAEIDERVQRGARDLGVAPEEDAGVALGERQEAAERALRAGRARVRRALERDLGQHRLQLLRIALLIALGVAMLLSR